MVMVMVLVLDVRPGSMAAVAAAKAIINEGRNGRAKAKKMVMGFGVHGHSLRWRAREELFLCMPSL